MDELFRTEVKTYHKQIGIALEQRKILHDRAENERRIREILKGKSPPPGVSRSRHVWARAPGPGYNDAPAAAGSTQVCMSTTPLVSSPDGTVSPAPACTHIPTPSPTSTASVSSLCGSGVASPRHARHCLQRGLLPRKYLLVHTLSPPLS